MGLFKRTNNNKTILRQISDLVPDWILKGLINGYHSDNGCNKYLSHDQFVASTFVKLCKCSTVADIGTGLSVSETFRKEIKLR